jgi:hypothetical protein
MATRSEVVAALAEISPGVTRASLTEIARYLDEADEGLIARNKRGSTAVQMTSEHIVNLLLATAGPRATDAVAAVKLFRSLMFTEHVNSRWEGVEPDQAPELVELLRGNFAKVLAAHIDMVPLLEAMARQAESGILTVEVMLDFSRRRASISMRDRHETTRVFHYTVVGETPAPRTGVSKVTIFGWDVMAQAYALALHSRLSKHKLLKAFTEGQLPAQEMARLLIPSYSH